MGVAAVSIEVEYPVYHAPSPTRGRTVNQMYSALPAIPITTQTTAATLSESITTTEAAGSVHRPSPVVQLPVVALPQLYSDGSGVRHGYVVHYQHI